MIDFAQPGLIQVRRCQRPRFYYSRHFARYYLAHRALLPVRDAEQLE